MKWISVLDGMPEHEEEILFLELISSQFVNHGYYDEKNNWWITFSGDKRSGKRITHWMYIPELPSVDDCWEIKETIYNNLTIEVGHDNY